MVVCVIHLSGYAMDFGVDIPDWPVISPCCSLSAITHYVTRFFGVYIYVRFDRAYLYLCDEEIGSNSPGKQITNSRCFGRVKVRHSDADATVASHDALSSCTNWSDHISKTGHHMSSMTTEDRNAEFDRLEDLQIIVEAAHLHVECVMIFLRDRILAARTLQCLNSILRIHEQNQTRALAHIEIGKAASLKKRKPVRRANGPTAKRVKEAGADEEGLDSDDEVVGA